MYLTCNNDETYKCGKKLLRLIKYVDIMISVRSNFAISVVKYTISSRISCDLANNIFQLPFVKRVDNTDVSYSY